MIFTKPLTYGLGIALGLSLVWGGWQWRGKQAALTQASKALVEKAEAEKALFIREGEIAQARELFEREARAMEQRHAADMNRIERETQERVKEKGDEAYNRAVADVRAGRLRNVWTCPAAKLPGVVGAAAQSDEGPDDREAAIGSVLRIAAECDAQVLGLQQVIKADREMK